MTIERKKSYTSLANEGYLVSALGSEFNMKASFEETGGLMEVMESIWPPQGGMPPHIHAFDEIAYFYEGEMKLTIDNKTVEAATGAFVYIPKDVVHAWHNDSSTTCKALIIFMPKFEPGLRNLLEELAGLPQGEPDMAKVSDIFSRHGTRIIVPE
ncbi:MAG: hypothetical protein HeimC2_42820 [Candidatus Heimdallarchaeota archaeon LC_2]|nr:MAG: hypothetical protein HeimC2_42820 [Candidatus Heimdallarchaeota archaeon LC_2]